MADRVLEDTKNPNSPGLPGVGDTAAMFPTVLFSKPLNQHKLASSLPESGMLCSASSSTASRALCQSGTEVVGTLLMGQSEPGHFVWTSPLRRTCHARRQPITTDLPGPLPRPEQYPVPAPPVTVDENWPILYRPPPQSDRLTAPVRAVDPDEPPPF